MLEVYINWSSGQNYSKEFESKELIEKFLKDNLDDIDSYSVRKVKKTDWRVKVKFDCGKTIIRSLDNRDYAHNFIDSFDDDDSVVSIKIYPPELKIVSEILRGADLASRDMTDYEMDVYL